MSQRSRTRGRLFSVFQRLLSQRSGCHIRAVSLYVSHRFPPSSVASQVSLARCVLTANDVSLSINAVFHAGETRGMEERQSTSFHMERFNQSVMTRCCKRTAASRRGCGVSRSRDSCFWGGANPHPSPERSRTRCWVHRDPCAHLSAPHTTKRAR